MSRAHRRLGKRRPVRLVLVFGVLPRRGRRSRYLLFLRHWLPLDPIFPKHVEDELFEYSLGTSRFQASGKHTEDELQALPRSAYQAQYRPDPAAAKAQEQRLSESAQIP
jgi:hypothetical protein